MAITEISVSKIYILATEPTNKVKDRFWFDTTNNLLKRYDGTSWKPISVSSDDVVVLSSGNKISLTNYLNTQIAALAEGIDSKQDKLECYSEVNADGETFAKINASAVSIGGSATNEVYIGYAERYPTIYIGNPTSIGDGIVATTEINGNIGGDALHTSISSTPSDNKLLSEKAIATAISGKADKATTLAGYNISDAYTKTEVNTELGKKQDKLETYSEEVTEYNSKVTIGAYEVKTNAAYVSIKGGDDVTIDGGSVTINSSSDVVINGLVSGTAISTSIPASTSAVDTKVPSEKAVKTELDKKQDKLTYYSEVSGGTPSATISVANIKLTGKVAEGTGTTASGVFSHAEGGSTEASGDYSHAEGIFTTALKDYSHAEGRGTTASSYSQHAQGKFNIEDANNKYADIIGNGTSSSARSNAATVSWEGISWSKTDVRAGGTDQDAATHSLSAKQNSTDTALNTTDKTIVGAINEIKSLVIGNTLPTPITDVKTITTTLENLITDTQYANKPGTILINPAITNVGTILVGEGITDINKAFPIYTDQPVTIAFKNINDFKVAGNIAGDKFNYIISFGYINTNIVSDNLKITTTNGVYEITPEGDAESMTLKLSKIS